MDLTFFSEKADRYITLPAVAQTCAKCKGLGRFNEQRCRNCCASGVNLIPDYKWITKEEKKLWKVYSKAVPFHLRPF